MYAQEKRDTYYTTGGNTAKVFKKKPYHDVLLSIVNDKTVAGLQNKFDSMQKVSVVEDNESAISNDSNECCADASGSIMLTEEDLIEYEVRYYWTFPLFCW